MNNNLEFENEDPSPDSIEDNHPRTNYGEGYGGKIIDNRPKPLEIPTSISVGVYYYIDEETGKPVFDTDSMTNEFETKLNNL